MLRKFETLLEDIVAARVAIDRDGEDIAVFCIPPRECPPRLLEAIRARKSELLALLDDEDDATIDYDPDGNPRGLPREIVIGRDGGVGPPPANV